MRRTLWLTTSPWLVVAVTSAAGGGLGLGLAALLTTEDGGMGNLGPALFAAGLGLLLGQVGAVVLLYVVARRAFGARAGAAAVGWTVLGGVLLSALLTGVTLLLGAEGTLALSWVLAAPTLPLAGTVTFLVTERRRTAGFRPPLDA